VSAKAYDIINRNFTSELHQKETEVEAIDTMLLQVQKSLHMVRYAAVSNMFSGPQITRSSGQVRSQILPTTDYRWTLLYARDRESKNRLACNEFAYQKSKDYQKI